MSQHRNCSNCFVKFDKTKDSISKNNTLQLIKKYDILKPGRTVSIYLKHSLEGGHSSDFHEKGKLIREMEDKNLLFDEEICATLAYDIELVEWCVFNFNKKRYQKQNTN